tara:strand:+ start:621 stop:941 length:321 start_codon:yes stop_codon:yes gene_type:complete
MANIDRLTKRVKKMEEWIDENGGGETLGNFNFLLDAYRGADTMVLNTRRELEMFRNLLQEFLTGKKLMDEWNEFIKEKDDAVQEQQTEEAESSEEASEAPVEETKD